MRKSIHVACHAALLSALFSSSAFAVAQTAPATPSSTSNSAGVSSTATLPADKTASDTAPASAVTAEEKKGQAIFARVGDTVITQAEYDAALIASARAKFYHGKAPEKDVAALQRSVSDELVNRVLLLREARLRGLTVDREVIKKTLDNYEKRYSESEAWKKNRENIILGLTARLEEDNLLSQLEKAVRNLPEPDVEAVRGYYKANPDKFTEPERVRVSLILKPVEPTAPVDVWDKAAEEISAILKQIREGADFAEMARQHSKAKSAEAGGDMGYLHKGMLPEPVQDLLGTLKPGDISEPLRLLEGVGLMLLTDRVEPKTHEFERVEKRARDLLKRDNANAAWKNLIAELKKATPPQVDESKFLPLAENSGDSAAPK